MIASPFYFDLRNAEGLSREESTILFYRAKSGDLAARDRLIESVLKLAWSIAKNFWKNGVPPEDFVAEANLCVVTNWHKWIPEKTAFTTYIGTCVKNRMGEFLWLKEHNGVFIPRQTMRDLKNTIHIMRSPRREQHLKNARKLSKITLFSSLRRKETGPENIPQEPQFQSEFCIADINDLLHNLDSAEVKTIQLKVGLLGDPPANLAEIARQLDVSMVEAKKLQDSAIQKIRLNYVFNRREANSRR